MFRSSTIIRELALNLAKVIFMLKHSVKLRRCLLCGCVAACCHSLPIDMLLSAVSVLVVAQSSSEIPEGLMNNPVCTLPVLHRFILEFLYRHYHCVV